MTPLKKYLFMNFITITDFARELDVSPSYISNIAAGKLRPGPKLARRIEYATKGEITKESLVFGSIPPKKD